MKPRAAWPVLVKKAQERCEQAQAELVQARERVKSLEASRARMDKLYNDYVDKCKAAEQQAQSITVTQSYRNFIQQLQTLIQRVDLDVSTARQQLNFCRQALLAADKKRLQMQTLMDKDLERVRQWRDKREQQAMDATGVMLYNLKTP